MARRIKAMILLVSILAVALTQPGCWDHQEVERLGIVLSMALDQAPDGRVRLTVQTISPKAVAGGQVGGGGGGGGGGVGITRPFRNLSVEGSTIFDCIRLMSLRSPLHLFFAHNQIILISEGLAQSRGIEELVDFFDRNPQIRRSNWVLVSRSDISSVMEIPGELVATPSQRMIEIIRDQKSNSFFPAMELGEFLEGLEAEGRDAFAAGIEVDPNEAEVRDKMASDAVGSQKSKSVGSEIKIGGTAVFAGSKLAGWLNERESRGLLWVRGKVKGGAIDVPCGESKAGGEGLKLALEIIRNGSKIEPELTGGELSVTVRINVETSIQEAQCMEELDLPEVIKQYEDALAEAIRGEVEAALVKTQREYHSDVFGFGESIHRKYPGRWKELQPNWSEVYSGLPVYVVVDAKISRTGLITKPVRYHR